MKKTSIMLLLLVAPMLAMADHISERQAREAALGFVADRFSVSARSVQGKAANMKLAARNEYHYIYNVGEKGGYVIVAADDAVGGDLVLGYADSGRFDADSIPPALRWWIGEYDRQMDYLRRNGMRISAAPQQNTDENQMLEIKPMLTSKWGQVDPFNRKCPKEGDDYCPTGCLSTALAQILYYNRWPEKGYGFVDGTDLSAHTYRWDEMTDTYDAGSSKASIDAVATLMADLGKASKTKYSMAGSGAYPYNGMIALRRNFGYRYVESVSRADNMTPSEWMQTIYEELEAGRPVMYSGFAPGGGHSFVADGYKDGFLHINWGWYGNCDGYYKPDAFNPTNPETGFNFSQTVIIGIGKENTSSDPGTQQSGTVRISSDGTFGCKETLLECGSEQTMTGHFDVSCSVPMPVQFGVEMLAPDGRMYRMRGEKKEMNEEGLVEEYTVGMNGFPDTDGAYILTPAAWNGKSRARIKIKYDGVEKRQVVVAYKKGGNLRFLVPDNSDNVRLSNFNVVNLKDKEGKLGVSATISCLGMYYGETLYLGILDGEDNVLSYVYGSAVSLVEGGSVDIYGELDAPAANGEYTVAVMYRDDSGFKVLKDFSKKFYYEDESKPKEDVLQAFMLDGISSLSPREADHNMKLMVELYSVISAKEKRSVRIGLKVIDMEGNATYLKSEEVFDITNGSGINNFEVDLKDFPTADGNYYVSLYAVDLETDEWVPFMSLYNVGTRSFLATVESGKIKFPYGAKLLERLNIECEKTPEAYTDQPFNLKLKATCTAYDICTKIYVGLCDKDGNVHLYKDEFVKPNLDYGESTIISLKPNFTSAEGFTAGVYKMGLFIYRGKNYLVSNLIDIEIKNPVADLRLEEVYVYDKEVASKDMFRVAVTVNNYNCPIDRKIAAFVFEADGSVLVDSISQDLSMPRNNTKLVYFAWKLKGVEEGKTYLLKIYTTDDSGIWLPMPEEMGCINGETFSIASPSGISGVGRLPDGTTEIYTATGMKVGGYEGTAPLPKGMYILRRGGKTVKVCVEK